MEIKQETEFGLCGYDFEKDTIIFNFANGFQFKLNYKTFVKMNKIIEKKGEASVKLSASFFLLCQPKLFEKELKELEETIRNCRQKKEKKCSCKQPTSPCPILDIAKKMRRLKGKRN